MLNCQANFSALEEQPGDEDVRWFSYDERVHVPLEQVRGRGLAADFISHGQEDPDVRAWVWRLCERGWASYSLSVKPLPMTATGLTATLTTTFYLCSNT